MGNIDWNVKNTWRRLKCQSATWKIKLLALVLLLFFLNYRYHVAYNIYCRTRTSLIGKRVDYTFQHEYAKYDATCAEYRITLVSDMDLASRVHSQQLWRGIIKEGRLLREGRRYRVVWTDEAFVYSGYNEGGRGMELSELVHYNGKMLTCDDRTGIVYEILQDRRALAPRWILTDMDDAQLPRGFKCEWMAVKGDRLYIGSTGREFVDGDKVTHHRNMQVKVIDASGGVESIDWVRNYRRLRAHASSSFPGYLIHEAAGWSQMMNTWVFMPRRRSAEAYDEQQDELKGTNVVLFANEDFSNITKTTIGPANLCRGVSSFKFIPFREHEVVVVKSVEYKNVSKSYLLVVDVSDNSILMEETEISANVKFEGVEVS